MSSRCALASVSAVCRGKFEWQAQHAFRAKASSLWDARLRIVNGHTPMNSSAESSLPPPLALCAETKELGYNMLCTVKLNSLRGRQRKVCNHCEDGSPDVHGGFSEGVV